MFHVNCAFSNSCFYSLRLIAPVLKDHGVEYERGKFNEKLANGSVNMSSTHKLMKEAVTKVWASGKATLEALRAGDADAFAAVHTEAMVSLVTQSGPINIVTLPATLLFDMSRMVRTQFLFGSLVQFGSMVVVLTQWIKTFGDNASTHAMRQILSDLIKMVTSDMSIGEFVFDFVKDTWFQRLDSSNLADELARNMLKFQIEALKNDDSTIKKLM